MKAVGTMTVDSLTVIDVIARRSLLVVVATLMIDVVPRVTSLDNGLARTPPMGWMTRERFGCNVDCDTYPDDCIRSTLAAIHLA